ncbi:MAG: T9SS type A sorting domain-containing protein [bacterium]
MIIIYLLFPALVFSWQIQTIDDSPDDVGAYSSIACDSSGKPYISYTNLTTGGLKYAYFNGSFWTTNTIGTTGSVGYYTSIDLDSSNNPHISHYNATSQRLLYTKGIGTTSLIVDQPYVGKFSSLKIDTEQYPAISYYDERNKALKFAFWTGGYWATSTVDYALNKDRGRFSSLFLVEDSLPCMTYYDATDGDLRFAFWNTTTWGSRTIDTIGDVGQYSSLAGNSGSLHIAYYDVTNANLKYAINPDGTWTLYTIDSLGDVGKYCSCSIDGSDTVWISYYDATNKDLKIAYGSSSSWANETIDSIGDVGMYSSIVIHNNIVYISYYDETNGNLKYATLGTETAPSSPSNLSATAISSSTINLAFNDNSTNELWFVIERGSTITSFSFIGTTTQGTYTDSSLSSNTTYYYRVCAYNSFGTSSYSNIASATTFDIPPIAPSNLQATATGSSTIDLSWNDNSSNELWFVIEMGSTITAFVLIGTTTQSTYTSTGLLASTTYYYRVCSYNLTGGQSGYSNIASATTFNIIPNSPSSLTASAVSNSEINLSWSDNSNNELWFIIERGGTITSFSFVGTTTSSTYLDINLLSNTRYYYRVASYNEIGTSSYSNIASVTTGSTTLYLSPSYLVIGSGSIGTVNVMVDNVSNVVGVSIYLSFNPQVLSVSTITQGSFPSGASLLSSSFNNASGTLIYASSLFSGSATGFGTIASIAFYGTSGTSAISFEISTNSTIEKTNLIDNHGCYIPFNVINGSASVSIPGDADGSGQVNLLDFYILRSEFGQSGPNLASDFNHDGTVDLLDFYILRQNFGSIRVKGQGSGVRGQDNVVLSIEPGKEAFNVKISNVSGLIGGSIYLSYNPSLECMEIEKGAFIDGAAILQSVYENGSISFSFGFLQGEVGGNGTLLVVKFKEKNPNLVILPQTRLMDRDGAYIPYKISNENVSMVKIEPSDSSIFIDGTKTIGIFIKAPFLIGANIEMEYPGDKLEPLHIQNGNFSDVFLFSTSTGKITIIGAKLGSPTQGLITLANITFKALKEGTASLLFSLVDLRDSTNTKIAAEGFSGTITIRKYITGDLNRDEKIDFDDLMLITLNWKKENIEYDIGPASGIPPDLISSPDGIIDFEDLMVFCLMWNWQYRVRGSEGQRVRRSEGLVWMEREGDEFVVKYSGFSNIMGGNITFSFDGEASIKTEPSIISLPFIEGGRMGFAFASLPLLSSSGIIARIRAGNLKIEDIDIRDNENKKVNVQIQEEIKPLSLNNVICYPNPAKSTDKVLFKYLPSNTTIRIYNIAGEEVFEKENFDNNPKWEIKNISSGVYIYVLSNGKDKKIGKLGVVK